MVIGINKNQTNIVSKYVYDLKDKKNINIVAKIFNSICGFKSIIRVVLRIILIILKLNILT